MAFQAGAPGGSQYIVIERTGDRFRATERIEAPLTRAPLVFVPDAVPGFQPGEALPAAFYARIIDDRGIETLVTAADPTGVEVEFPRRGETHGLAITGLRRFRFRLRIPARITPISIDLFSAACTGAFANGRPRPFPVDLRNLPPPRPISPPVAQRFPTWRRPALRVAMTICLVGDGYTPRQESEFLDDCRRLRNEVDRLGLPMAIGFVPAFRPSMQPGTDYAAGCNGVLPVLRATQYDTTYGFGGGECAILAGDPTNAWDDQDAVGASMFIGLVNADTYGGSSWGDHAWLPAKHPDFVDLALHELGHMLKLRDEYDTPLAGHFTNVLTYANVTTTPATPHWGGSGSIYANTACPASANHQPIANAGPGEVAAFQGAAYEPCTNYRPSADCKMRHIDAPFCAVCLNLLGEYLRAAAGTPP